MGNGLYKEEKKEKKQQQKRRKKCESAFVQGTVVTLTNSVPWRTVSDVPWTANGVSYWKVWSSRGNDVFHGPFELVNQVQWRRETWRRRTGVCCDPFLAVGHWEWQYYFIMRWQECVKFNVAFSTSIFLLAADTRTHWRKKGLCDWNDEKKLHVVRTVSRSVYLVHVLRTSLKSWRRVCCELKWRRVEAVWGRRWSSWLVNVYVISFLARLLKLFVVEALSAYK